MATGAAPQSVDALLERASKLLNDKAPEEALAAIGRAFAEAPERADVWGYWGLALHGLGRWEEAAEKLRKSAELDSTDATVWYYLGDSLYGLKQWAEAAHALSRSVEHNPSDENAWVGLAATHVQLRDLVQALEATRRGLEAVPGSEKILEARATVLDSHALALIAEDRFPEALAAIDEALGMAASEPQRGSRLFARATALSRLDRYAEALEGIEEAERLNAPERGAFAFSLLRIMALTALGRHTDVLAATSSAIRDSLPEIERGWLDFHMGIALNGVERYREAIETLLGSELSLLPAGLMTRIEFERGRALLRLDRPAEALEAAERGLPQADQDLRAGLMRVRGTALNQLERYAEALESLTQVKELVQPKPDAAEFWVQYGGALAASGRHQEAEEVIVSALQTLESGGPSADQQQLAGGLLILTAIREKLGKFGEAVESLERAMSLLPPKVNYWDKKASLLHRAGKLQGALEAYEAAVSYEPALAKNIAFWMARAGILGQLGQYDLIVSRVAPELEDHPMTLAMRGSALMTADRMEEAWPFLKRAAVVPAALEGEWMAWFGCAIAHVGSGRPAQAREALAKVAALSPEALRNENFALMEALALQGSHEYERALERLRDAPQNDLTRLLRGMVLTELGKTEEALSVLDAVAHTEGSPLAPKAAFAKALLLMRARRSDEALQAFHEALAGRQGKLDRMLSLSGKALALCVPRISNSSGAVRIEDGLTLLAEAESIAESLPEGVPARGFPAWAKAVLLSVVEREEEAIVACQRAERMEGPSPYILLTMGECLLAMEDYEKALGCFERAGQNPADRSGLQVDALMAQGTALRKLERYEESVEAYRAALALPARPEREESDVWMGLAETYSALHRFRAAAGHFRRAVQASSKPARTASRAGTVLLRHKRDEEALEFLREAKSKGAKDAEIDFNIGVALYRLERGTEARAAWKEAADAGLEKAQKVLRDFDKLGPRAVALLDHWFGQSAGWGRKVAAAILLVIGFGCAALSSLQPNAIPGLNTGQPWTTTGLPALVALIILALPAMTGLKAGPVELQLSPAETVLPMQRTTLDALIDRALAAPATLAAIQGQSMGSPAGGEKGSYEVLAMRVRV